MGWGIAAGLAVSAAAQYFGSKKEAEGYDDMAKQAKKRGIEQHAFNRVAAKSAMASGQVASLDETRQAELIASRAVAVASAGGFIEDIDHLLADIDGEGAYRASIVMREAEQRAEGLIWAGEQAEKYGTDQADLYEGQADAAKISGITGLFNAGLRAGEAYGWGATSTRRNWTSTVGK